MLDDEPLVITCNHTRSDAVLLKQLKLFAVISDSSHTSFSTCPAVSAGILNTYRKTIDTPPLAMNQPFFRHTSHSPQPTARVKRLMSAHLLYTLSDAASIWDY